MKVVTVRGEISPDQLGRTLPHEHLLIDLRCAYREPEEASKKAIGKSSIVISNLYDLRRDPYINEDALTIFDVDLAIKEVKYYRRAGGCSLVEMTLPGIGRDPSGIRAISEATGLNIVMGSGFYTEASHPRYLYEMDSDQIAEMITKEIVEGVDDSGLRAGIIGEIGCSWAKRGSVTPSEEKVLRGAARAQARTRAPLNIHPYFLTKNPLTPLRILREEGAELTKVAVSHLDTFLDIEYHKQIAETGAYVEYDCFGVDWTFEKMPYPPPGFQVDFPKDVDRIKALRRLIDLGFLDQLLISQEVCMKIYLKSYGGHGYDHILRRIVPMMRSMGMSKKQIDALTIDNPAKFLAF